MHPTFLVLHRQQALGPDFLIASGVQRQVTFIFVHLSSTLIPSSGGGASAFDLAHCCAHSSRVTSSSSSSLSSFLFLWWVSSATTFHFPFMISSPLESESS